MPSSTDRIRPRAELLRQMPTLARQSRPGEGPDYVLELKMERPGERYWLCTRGAAASADGAPDGWVEGYVTPEYRCGVGPWEAGFAYGPGETSWLQGYDYLGFLNEEKDRLEKAHEKAASHTTAQQMEVVQGEIEAVQLALRRKPEQTASEQAGTAATERAARPPEQAAAAPGARP